MIDLTNQPDHYPLDSLASLEIHAAEAEWVTWQGYPALRLNGLAFLPEILLEEARVEVCIATEGTCYPGIAFRVQDVQNYELAYAQPHTSGMWDALQYDPVINGTNTWQLYHGPAYQKAAKVPTGSWFRLRVDFKASRAAVRLDDQPPLLVRQLAHPVQSGRIGIWTYLPAYFRDLKIWKSAELPRALGVRSRAPEGTVTDWQADGLGTLSCEPGGQLNLNRYLPVEASEVTLRKRFTMSKAGCLVLSFGFSDELILSLDSVQIYTGEHLWKPSSAWKERGYVDIQHALLSLDVSEGEHELVARLRKKEYFGWGLIMKLRYPQLEP